MSNKDLQRLTDCVSYIGQRSRRCSPPCRNHFTQKVRIANQRTLYISVHDHPSPSELFLRPKWADCTPELIGRYDVIAYLMSLAPQYGTSLEKLADLLTGAQFTLYTPVSDHDRPKHCSSLSDLIDKHLLVEYCKRHELRHVQERGKGE